MSNVNYQDLNMEDLFQLNLSQEDIASLPEPSQGGAFLSHPTGGYRIQAESVDVKQLGADDRFNPGRIMGHIQAAVMAKDGTPLRGKVFFDVSHEAKVNTNNPTLKDGKPNYDRAYKLFMQAAKALGVEKEPVTAIYDAIGKYPMDAFLTEDFYQKGVPGSYKRNGTPAEIAAWREEVKAGTLHTKNSVASISKIKD